MKHDEPLTISDVRLIISSVYHDIESIYSHGVQGAICHGDIEALRRCKEDLHKAMSTYWTMKLL